MSDFTSYTTVFRAKLNADAQHRVTKRNRPAVSCTACRTRKQRCDRLQPCAACSKRGDAEGCRYAPMAIANSSSGSSPTAPRQEAQLRLQRLEEMVNGLLSRGGEDEGSPPAARATSLTTSRTSPASASGPFPNSTADGSSITLSSAPTEAADMTAPLGVDGPFVGPTHWVAVLQSIRDIPTYLEADSAYHASSSEPPPPTYATLEPADHIFARSEPLSTQEILATLPSHADCDRLLATYFQSRTVVVPFLHAGQFQRAYTAFWDRPGSTSVLWVSTLASILTMGAHIYVVRGNEPPVPPKELRRLAIRLLIAGDFLKGPPLSVEALMLCAMTRVKSSSDADPLLWSDFGVVVRLAQKST